MRLLPQSNKKTNPNCNRMKLLKMIQPNPFSNRPKLKTKQKLFKTIQKLLKINLFLSIKLNKKIMRKPQNKVNKSKLLKKKKKLHLPQTHQKIHPSKPQISRIKLESLTTRTWSTRKCQKKIKLKKTRMPPSIRLFMTKRKNIRRFTRKSRMPLLQWRTRSLLKRKMLPKRFKWLRSIFRRMKQCPP